MEILKLSDENAKGIIKRASRALIEGKVIIAPTDTVYGIMCSAFEEKAIERIFLIKQRPPEKPLALFVKNIEAAKDLAEISPEQEELLRNYWPGAVTFILKAKNNFSPLLVKDGKIGLRMPDHPIILDILKESGLPLAQSSANISKESTPDSAKEIAEIFSEEKNRPDLIIDDSQIELKPASTVLDIAVLPPKVLRK